MMFVVSFLLSIFLIQRTVCEQCLPCFCDCGGFNLPPPCINCYRRNLKEIPVFHFNITNSVKTLILHENRIRTLPHGIFKNYTNLKILTLGGNIKALHPHFFQHLEMLEQLYLIGNEINDISNDTFTGFRRLKILNLVDNQIQTLHPNTFQHLEMLEILRLTENKISDIPNDIFTTLRRLKYLYLNKNQIQTLHPNTFQHQEMLVELGLDRNDINDISNDSFTGLTRLKHLYLQENRIKTLHPNTFQHQEILEKLSLGQNEINDISVDMFTGLTRLKHLHLQNNRIKTLHPNTFQHLEMLEQLYLIGNEINDISNDTFTGFRRLKYLYLNENQIQTLHPNTFQHLEMLEILRLTENKISDIPNDIFTALRRLKYLYLNKNQIQTLHPNTFRYQDMLEELLLGGNKINDISVDMFTGLTRLKLLYLQDNRIRTLHPNTFQHQEILEKLLLGQNEINDISVDMFTGLTRLNYLNLQDNRIKTLHPNTFQHQEILEKLSLGQNEINDISVDMFTRLTRLKHLYLPNNRIKTLHPNTFRYQEMLEELKLDGNEINDISNTAFTGLTRLKYLYLQNNRIKTLHPNTFQHQKMLEKLHLDRNEINDISNTTFTGLTRLKYLYLQSNQIQTLHPNTFRYQEMLEKLLLHYNNISNVMDNAWNGLVRLCILDLWNNQLQRISVGMFSNLLSLSDLSLDGNPILSIERDAFLNIRNLKILNLRDIDLKEIPDALWIPSFYDTVIDIRYNLFQCSCKLQNDVNQLKFKVKKLKYSASYFEKQCRNITTVCEEERNFALGMLIETDCVSSLYNITDGNDSSPGICMAHDPCKLYLRIILPGDIVVTNVIVKMELSKLNSQPRQISRSVTVEIGDQISDRYKKCNNFTLETNSGVKLIDNNCTLAPVGRNLRINVSTEGYCWRIPTKFYEVVVEGYDQNKYNLWSNWRGWSACSKTCDNGQRLRTRICNNPTSLECLLPNTDNQRSSIHEDKEICNDGPCFREVYQWTIGGVCGLFMLILFGIIFWYRKFKMITYFDGLRPNPNFVMDPDRTLLEQIEELPYDLHWEFPRYDVKFGSVIGEGHFGRVWLAKAKGIKAFDPRDKSDLSSRAKLAKLQDQRVHQYFTTVTEAWVLGDSDTTRHYEVAVKTLKECATPKHEKDLANELKLLIYMGQHPNIINILASCTIRGDLWVILEYCDYGSLKKFLSDQRHTFIPAWSKQSVDISTEICFFDLLRICEQIAKGIMFLSSWRVVHRDISARNILVDANFNVKIADFGLARSDGFVASPDDVMPIKWSALESLLRHEYTLQSDIWSVGVLYWEIFSLGEVPYPGMSSKEVIAQLKQGYRMEPPNNCPPEIWTIIMDCWQASPESRPSAAELFEQLDEVKVSVCAAPDGQYYGTSHGSEYDEAGTVKGPSLKMLLETKENTRLKDEKSILRTLPNTQKEADKKIRSGPSTIAYDKYQNLETDILTLQKKVYEHEESILTLQNALSDSNRKVYEHEERESKIKNVLETVDLQDENIRKIRTIMLIEKQR